MAAMDERWSDAARYYRQACEIEPDYLSFACGPILESHRRAGCLDEFDHWLAESIARRPMTTALLALARRKATTNPDQAADLRMEHPYIVPTMQEMDTMLGNMYEQ